MGLYESAYKLAKNIGRPLHRRSLRLRHGAFDLGKGRPRRKGRALVAYVSDYVRHVTREASHSVWDRDDLDQTLDRLCVGKFAGHENHRTSADLVRELIARGFVVDCIYDRSGYLIEDVSKYDVILDEWNNMGRWAAQNPKARKLFLGTTCHWLYGNRAELQRLDWIFRRRGVSLAPERQLPAMLGQADADLVTYYGNDEALQHYGPAQAKLRKVWVCPTAASSAFSTKDWSAAKKRFLWFGSSSWVHRGLDLVLEAFMELPDLELFICGSDQRFLEVYGEGLKKCRNIHHVGFVTPDSEQFRELVLKTATVVYASAAEGCSTSIVQCMRFGLIPIATEATGLSVHDFWPALAGQTDLELIADIAKRCTALAEIPDQEVEVLSRRFWEFAATHHSRESFRKSFGAVLDELLA
jgi:glycosyltransferase involved in cell wall biosynthesis